MSGTRTFRRSLRASIPHFVQPLKIRDEDGLKILECHVDGCPKPEIRWEKSGKPIGKSRRIHMNRSGDMCLLQIRMFQTDDAGLYTCIATNIVGSVSTHIKVGTAYETSIKKDNGVSSQNLSPNKTIGLRSRSMERSRESVNDKTLHQCLRSTRSSSTSRNPRQDPINVTTKSKLSVLTNTILKRTDGHRKLEVVNINKKELSKSMEDCRKPKKGFFNKVKVPDIFLVQKQDSVQIDTTSTQILNGKIVSLENKHNRVNVNGNGHTSLKKQNSKNSPGQKIEVNGELKPRSRISLYLKRFENANCPKNSKESVTERGSSLKDIKSKKTLNKNLEDADSENFFNIGKFIRRKSNGSTKKSSDIGNDSTFVSHISADFKDTVEVVSQNNAVNNNGMAHGASDDITRKITKLNSNQQKEKAIDILPDITGFSLITEDDIRNKNENSRNEYALVSDSGKVREDSEVKQNTESTIDEIIVICEPPQRSSLSDSQSEQAEDRIKNAQSSTRSEKQIPSIHVHEVSEEKSLPELKSSTNTTQRATEENSSENVMSTRGPCKGKIRYSSPLIEEVEALLDSKTQVESVESDLQRVSSPVESPARIVKGPQSVTVLRGESVTLAICFTGNPVPNVLWMKGGRVLRCSDDGRLSILEGREMSVVTVNEVTADDSGKYVVCVENDGGGDSRFASVAVVGFPEPPGGEPTASEVTDHSIVLSWYGSMYDGGSVVTGYVVEMCTLPDTKWHKVASSVNTSCSIQGLSMGQRYLFRVRAENRYGVSHPSKDSKIICLNDFLQYETSSDEEPEDVPEKPVTIENGTQWKERFDLKEEVGKGRFGIVYRCVELSSGLPRAAKFIRCLKMKDKEKVRQEIEIMSRLHHPKLMQVLAAFESGRNMIMIMEFISGGELFERVIADDFVLTEHDCILFMKQICDGVSYIHKNNILHLDLKPENILCKTRTSHKIKIIDFGLARVYVPNDSLRILFGTPEFIAPEVVNYEPVGPASDMWSVGVICYVLLSGLSPFMGENDTETYANITRGEMDFDDDAFDEISQDAKNFISKLLLKNTKGRMSAEECLKHPWLATARLVQKRPLSTEKLKRFIIRRKWQKSGTAIRALGRIISLSRSSLCSSCDSYSQVGSPTSSRSRSSLVSRSETADSGDSEVFHDVAR